MNKDLFKERVLKKTVKLLTCVVLLGVSVASGAARELHVAPNGSDTNPGTKREPLATIEAARDAIRDLKEARILGNAGATVYLHKGTYRVSSTIEFDERDSGTHKTPIVYRSYGQDEVRIIGGVEVAPSRFGPVKDPDIRQRLLPDVRDHVLRLDLRALKIDDYGAIGPRGFRRPYRPAPLEIFVNDQAMHIARWPNADEKLIPIGEVIDKGSVPRQGDFSNRGGVFKFDTDRPKRWVQAKDIWLSGIFSSGFADDTVQVAQVDLEQKTIRTAQPTLYGFKTGRHWRAWYVLNLLEEIDQPGEYYVDAKAGTLYLYPPAGLKNAQIQISLLEEPIFALEGVSYLTFERLTVECSRGTAFYIERGAKNLIAGCTLRNLGIMGVQIGKGVTDFENYAIFGTGQPVSRRLGSWHEHVWINNDFLSEAGTGHTVLSCDIYNNGAGGVHINGGNRVTLEPGDNQIVNCELHHCNRLDRAYKAPVNLDGVRNRVAHCRIHDATNQAIYLQGNDQIIEYNEVYRTCLEVDDNAPLYTGMDPTQLGTQIRYNYWHDNGSQFGGNFSIIYFDSPGGQNATIHGNVFYRNPATWGQIFISRGQFFEVENNIFIESPLAVWINETKTHAEWSKKCDIRNMGERAALVEKIDFKSLPYSDRYPEYVNYGDEGWYSPMNNIIQRNVLYKCRGFVRGTGTRVDNLLTDEDPGFVDLANGDFRLKPDAPVFSKIPGFKPVPFDRMGLYRDAYRTSLPPTAP